MEEEEEEETGNVESRGEEGRGEYNTGYTLY